MNVLQKWMEIATATEKKALAFEAVTTVPALRQAAGAYKTGKLSLSPESAKRLEKASVKLNKINPALPILKREQLSLTCKSCEYAKACKGAANGS